MLKLKEKLRKACKTAINNPSYGLFMERKEHSMYAALFCSENDLPMYLAQIPNINAKEMEIYITELRNC